MPSGSSAGARALPSTALTMLSCSMCTTQGCNRPEAHSFSRAALTLNSEPPEPMALKLRIAGYVLTCEAIELGLGCLQMACYSGILRLTFWSSARHCSSSSDGAKTVATLRACLPDCLLASATSQGIRSCEVLAKRGLAQDLEVHTRQRPNKHFSRLLTGLAPHMTQAWQSDAGPAWLRGLQQGCSANLHLALRRERFPKVKLCESKVSEYEAQAPAAWT